MELGNLRLEYNIKGAKNQEEIEWVKGVGLPIHNAMAKESGKWTAGFNAIWDYLKQYGFKIEGAESDCDHLEPEQYVLYDQFMRGVYREFAKKNGGVRDTRIIQLDGINAILIFPKENKFVLSCTIEDLD